MASENLNPIQRMIKFFFPNYGMKIYKPKGKDQIITLPNGYKIKKMDGDGPLAVHHIVEIGGKYFARRPSKGNKCPLFRKWVRDPYPIEFE